MALGLETARWHRKEGLVRLGFAFLLLFAGSGCWSLSYLGQQGAGQLRLIQARRRVADVLTDPTVDGATKARLRLALAAREFGVRELGLRGGDAYTRFVDTAGAPVAWNLSAAPKDRLEPHLHHFPITGAVPYLGYFREADAREEEARLKAQEFDTYVRPVAGYSTLGFTADPIYSSMLEGSEARIVEVVLHEMLHGTVYLPGQSEWNESLATFVGLRGAAQFFLVHGNPEVARKMLDASREREREEEAFSRFLAPVVAELKQLYARPSSRAEKLWLREAVFAGAAAEFARRFPPRQGKKLGFFARQPLNNAVLVAYATYHGATPELRDLLARVGGDLAELIRACRHAVENHRDPLGYLRKLN